MEKNIENLLNEELNRFRSINSYIGVVNEQEADIEMDDEVEVGRDLPGESSETETSADTVFSASSDEETDAIDLDFEMDDDVEDTASDDIEASDETEELEVTDLIDGQKNLEDRFGDVESKLDATSQKMDSVSAKLDSFEEKFAELDGVYDAVTGIENKIEDMKPKTPEQKLELRSLDSYPFNQKLTDFFDEKGEEMDETGKDEYVLTVDDVENMSKTDIAKSFSIDNE